MTCVDIVLTKDTENPNDDGEPLETEHYGYMKPLTKEEMLEEPRLHEGGGRGGRGFRGGRGGRGGRGRGGARYFDREGDRGGRFEVRGRRGPRYFNDDDDDERPRRIGRFRGDRGGGRGGYIN